MAKPAGLPHTPGSHTSRTTAVSMVPHAPNQRERIWNHMEARGHRGATCQETEKSLRMVHQSVSTRMQELRQLGRLKRSGVTRLTDAKREADVHVIIEEADWGDKRPDWPTPTEAQRRSTVAKWRIRAKRWEKIAHEGRERWRKERAKRRELEAKVIELEAKS